jgi:hypothetical protein
MNQMLALIQDRELTLINDHSQREQYMEKTGLA